MGEEKQRNNGRGVVKKKKNIYIYIYIRFISRQNKDIIKMSRDFIVLLNFVTFD